MARASEAEPAPMAQREAEGQMVAPAKAGRDYSKYAGTSVQNALAGDLVSLGPPGEGKTIFAASGSETYPDEDTITKRFKAVKRWAMQLAIDDEKGTNLAVAMLPHFEQIVLEDMAWLAMDTAPLAGLNEMGIVCPHVLDFQAFTLDEGPIRAAKRIGEFMGDLLPPKLRFLVFDTMSNFDKPLVQALRDKYGDDPKASIGMWTELSTTHTRVRAELAKAARQRGGNLHTLIHGRAVGDANALPDKDGPQGRWKEMAVLNQEAAGKEPISGDITGKSANLYKGHSNFMFVIKREDVRLRKPAEELADPSMPTWWAYTQVEDWETKSRFLAAVGRKEKAHLGKIFAKLTALTGGAK